MNPTNAGVYATTDLHKRLDVGLWNARRVGRSDNIVQIVAYD